MNRDIKGKFIKGHKTNLGTVRRSNPLTPCECGCGEQIKTFGGNGLRRRFVKGHHGRGSRHYKWRGGISTLMQQIRGNERYLKWRRSIFQRDSFKCILCDDASGGNLNADHYPRSFAKLLDEFGIKELDDAINCPDLWSPDIARTLCLDCHKQTGTYGVIYAKQRI